MSVSMPENSLGCIKTFFVPSSNSNIKSRKFHYKTKLFSLPIWDSLTLLPYSKSTSRLINRHILASEGGDHE